MNYAKGNRNNTLHDPRRLYNFDELKSLCGAECEHFILQCVQKE